MKPPPPLHAPAYRPNTLNTNPTPRLHPRRALTAADLKQVTDLRAQEAASVSGATRAAEQQAAQAAAQRKASVPRALRDMPEEVLDKFRKARGDYRS